MLGLGLVTYKRQPFIKRLVERIRAFTESPYQLVVAEDGGGDGTTEWARANQVDLVTGDNKGVCWNKNRALFPLFLRRCDPILLIEDDCFPNERGWEREWIEACSRWHHLAYAHPKIANWQIDGKGTAESPFRNPKATAQCTGVSLSSLDKVGFLDTRFQGYGVGHVEWTSRFRRIKKGYQEVIKPDGTSIRCNFYITGGLVHEDGVTFRKRDSVERNKNLFQQIKRDPTFRLPWSSQQERTVFLNEMETCGVSLEAMSREFWLEIERSAVLPSEELPSLDQNSNACP